MTSTKRQPSIPHVGRVTYIGDNVSGAVKDIRNGYAELRAAISETKDKPLLLELRQIASELELDIWAIESAATEKLDKPTL